MVKEVARSIPAQGRSKSYHRRGLWAIKKKNGGKLPTHPKQAKKADGDSSKTAKFYTAEDVPQPIPRRFKQKPTKLRASITPGTVLILLAGRFKGKRVVFLKQLESGLLLVSGPFKLNGVPLRRVNQAYVIATSTKVDVSKVATDSFNDAYFKSVEKKERNARGADGFFEEQQKKKELPADYIKNQKTVDAALLGGLSADVKGYLSTRFGLKSGDRPHLMKF